MKEISKRYTAGRRKITLPQKKYALKHEMMSKVIIKQVDKILKIECLYKTVSYDETRIIFVIIMY